MVALGVFPQLSAGGPWGGRGSRGFSAVSGGWCCSVRPSPGACSAQWRGLPTVPPRPLFFAGSPVSWFHSSFGQVFRHYIKKAFHAVGHRTPILRAWNKSASLTVEDSFLEGPVYRPGVRPPCAQRSAPRSSSTRAAERPAPALLGTPGLPAFQQASPPPVSGAPRHTRSRSPQMFDEYPLQYSEWGSSNASKIR